jgi:primosomal protein N' (replication factor Y)
MHYYEVAPNQIIRAASPSFTYSFERALPIGTIVTVEVGKKTLVGIIIKIVKQPSYPTKSIHSILEDTPLPHQLVALTEWISHYYATHLALTIPTLLPAGLQKNRRSRKPTEQAPLRKRTKIVFTPEQVAAIDAVSTAPSGTTLLHGVTGSGKTSVYIELTERTLASGRSVIVLVPEIALTSQLVDEFSHHFDNIILTHSRQTEAERHSAWREALTSTLPRVIIGPRSALFSPIASVGLIVIDEAHEPSFKQEQAPRYSALRAASVLARSHRARLVLGSATPSIADFHLAEHTKSPIISMSTRARAGAIPPVVELVDMTKRDNFKSHRFLSNKLLAQITTTTDAGGQIIIFHNRRGSASTTLCEDCGWSALCPRCFLPLTLHIDKHHMRCHVCGYTDKVPTHCPACSNTNIVHKGIGTKLIESELARLFPNKTIGRFDGDNLASDSVDQRYNELYSGSIDIIIGTQVIAKGLDLPHLRAVGVIQADSGINLPDYGASERTFQLLAQVVGRVGRSHHPTTVVVQSYQPTHPAITTGLAQDYAAFYQHAVAERQRTLFPPFTHLLKLTCSYKTEVAAIKNAKKLSETLKAALPTSVQLLGPTPAFYERQGDSFRWQIVLKAQKRADLVTLLRHLPPTHWQFELDPTSLL